MQLNGAVNTQCCACQEVLLVVRSLAGSRIFFVGNSRSQAHGTAALSESLREVQIAFGACRLSAKAFIFVKDICYAHR